MSFAGGTFTTSLKLVGDVCARAGMPDNVYTLYQGLFSDTAQALQSDIKRIAILNVDGDLYESAPDALRIAGPFLQVGSVILFDDYNAFCADIRKGERRAFREFQAVTHFKFEPWFAYMYSGQAFLCVAD